MKTLKLLFLFKSMDWFLYDNGLRHERVKRDETSRILSRDEIYFERKPLIEYENIIKLIILAFVCLFSY